jgi:putative peptide zinc metalloprotease protein
MNEIQFDIGTLQGLQDDHIMDTVGAAPTYLLLGRNGSYIRVSPSAYKLLQSVSLGISFEELAETLNQRQQAPKITSGNLAIAYRTLVEKLSRIDKQAGLSKPPAGFWLRLPIFPARMVERVAAFLSFLYHPLIAMLLCSTVLAISLRTFNHGFKLDFGPANFVCIYMLFFLSMVAHEFGHAAACARFGGKPSDIGFTLYLIYPALYSDVNSAWQLKWYQRVIVDLGGVYFQLLFGAAFLLVTWATGWTAPKMVFVGIFYTTLFSLNPIFKFDGYWVISDLLGVSNLSQQPKRIVKFLFNRIRGRKTESLPWPRIVTAILIIYSATSIVVWSYFALRLFPTFINNLRELGRQFELVASQVAHGKLPHALEFWGLVTAFFINAIFVLMGWQVTRGLLRILRQAFPPLRKERASGVIGLGRI